VDSSVRISKRKYHGGICDCSSDWRCRMFDEHHFDAPAGHPEHGHHRSAQKRRVLGGGQLVAENGWEKAWQSVTRDRREARGRRGSSLDGEANVPPFIVPFAPMVMRWLFGHGSKR
jgi:hypothetical protein